MLVLKIILGVVGYWGLVTAIEKAKDKYTMWQDTQIGKKLKDEGKESPVTKPAEDFFSRWDKEKQWKKEHPIRGKIIDIWHTIRAMLWYRVPDYPYDIRNFVRQKYQRAVRGWSISDTWGFSHYLSRVIPEGLKHLKDNLHGYPCGMVETQAVALEEDEPGIIEWKKKIDEMIWTFETANKIMNYHWYYQSVRRYSEKRAEQMRESYKKLKKDFPDESWHVMSKDECKRYQEGWKLFQEYFFDLWD